MKPVPLALLLALALSACGTVQPTKSGCFGPSGTVTCTFTPLAELNAGGDRRR